MAGSIISALIALGSMFVTLSATKDARETIARNDAPAIFLDCGFKDLPPNTISEILGRDIPVYEMFHRAPEPTISLIEMPKHPVACTISNAGKLPIADIRLAFDVYYSDTSVFGDNTPHLHDAFAFPGIGGPPNTSGTLNLAPGDKYTFAFENTTIVNAWVAPRLHAEIETPTIGDAAKRCVPIYLSATTFGLFGVSPTPRKPSPGSRYDVPKLAALTPQPLGPFLDQSPGVFAISSCLSKSGYAVKPNRSLTSASP